MNPSAKCFCSVRPSAFKTVFRLKIYNKLSIFKSMLPAYGFYVRHADGVRLENVRVRYADGKEERPAVVIDDADVSIAGCDFMPPKGNPPLKTIVTR